MRVQHTFLFADLVGSTAITERLDAEETKLIVGDAIARVIRVVEAYGGTIKDLAGIKVSGTYAPP